MCTFTSWEMGQKKHAPSESDMAYTTLKIIQKMQFYTITVVGEKAEDRKHSWNHFLESEMV